MEYGDALVVNQSLSFELMPPTISERKNEGCR